MDKENCIHTHTCIYMKTAQWNTPNAIYKRGEKEGGNKNIMEGWIVQSVPYTCVELLQWNPLKLLMYANSKI
jgi:hypothetical protein